MSPMSLMSHVISHIVSSAYTPLSRMLQNLTFFVLSVTMREASKYPVVALEELNRDNRDSGDRLSKTLILLMKFCPRSVSIFW